MRKIDRYIGLAVFLGIFIVLFVLVGLFTFFTFIEEIEDIGKQGYSTWDATLYVVYLMPRHIYDLFPTAVLLGTLIGLGGLANNNELTVIRAAGVSIFRITLASLQVSLFLTLMAMLLGETIAPQWGQYAKDLRANAKSEHQVHSQTFSHRWYGYWGREGDDFISIQRILSDGGFGDIALYRLTPDKQLQTRIYARKAYYEQNGWRFLEVRKQDISTQGVYESELAEYRWDAELNPELVKHVVVRPDKLSSFGLYEYIQYLKRNEQNSDEYELALWSRLSYPVVSITMVFLAVPFIFGSLRSVAVGERILTGAFFGIGFYMLNKTVGNASLVYGWHPVFSALLPPLIFLAITIYLMRRKG
ncbi:LPS export ABC transporter permease LptG [Candidatus Albibeggiatoa sp. nov. NOAA]|uniref:LPS export ABC transporter permease LptG n=1 Tax=Candidatus Albibeggiatoa sp. nov. NOAA TaxID=3162724 RepID=UPI0032F5959B|nr:LPS export ABC transporter permease LptG [Thiotrichaceae bacterium]